MKLLIIGCGRSGTHYVSDIFRAVGLDLKHEEDGTFGKADWRAVGKDTRLYDKVWHQVRNPMDTIASWHTVMLESWKYANMVEPKIVSNGDLLLGSMRYWLYWNRLCRSKAEKSYQVEKLLDLLPSFLEELGLHGIDLSKAKHVSTSKDSRKYGKNGVNARFYPKITWKDLDNKDKNLSDEIREEAVKYGYQV